MARGLRRAVLVGGTVAALAWTAACGGSGPGDPDDETSQTRVVLVAPPTGGAPPTAEELERGGELLVERFTLAELPEPTMSVEDDRIILTVPGEVSDDEIAPLVRQPDLRFRKVLEQTVSPQSGVEPPTPAAPGTGRPDDDRTAAVRAAVGEQAWDAALSLTGPAEPDDAELAELLRPFAELSPADVAALPARIQFYAPVTCAQLDGRAVDATPAPQDLAVACDGDRVKLLLDAAALTGADVAEAGAQVQSGRWGVDLTFTEDGAPRWADLTQGAAENRGEAFEPELIGEDDRYAGPSPACAPATTGTSAGGCRVAITLDGKAISAPEIRTAIRGGQATISGEFSQEEARLLASQLQSGVLPLELHSITRPEGRTDDGG